MKERLQYKCIEIVQRRMCHSRDFICLLKNIGSFFSFTDELDPMDPASYSDVPRFVVLYVSFPYHYHHNLENQLKYLLFFVINGITSLRYWPVSFSNLSVPETGTGGQKDRL